VYAYAPASMFLRDADVREAKESAHVVLTARSGDQVVLVDRLLTGTVWNARPIAEADNPKRLTLYSMKGGVGRSTTAVVLAWHLARNGKRVLLFDLDLESPGVGATLLPQEQLPDFGIVDWFVEDALEQGDVILPRMVASSPIAIDLDGDIQVVPAYGRETGDYLPKLGRCYFERGPGGMERWTDRLRRLVQALESSHQPDVVLLDSRTGLHDTSAALILALGADTLLFAVESRQTWVAYRFLFDHFRTHPEVRTFRDRFAVVAALVPETEREEYLRAANQSAWDLFRETLYDDVPASSEMGDPFSFDLNAPNAPHRPLPIYWNRGLQTFDPTSSVDAQLIEAAYGQFLARIKDVFDLSSED
jgi:MinD-like ATPase involved in chromosome partitioning or flagellar assembly